MPRPAPWPRRDISTSEFCGVFCLRSSQRKRRAAQDDLLTPGVGEQKDYGYARPAAPSLFCRIDRVVHVMNRDVGVFLSQIQMHIFK